MSIPLPNNNNNLTLLEEYKILYNDTKRDKDSFMQMALTLKDVIENLKDVVKNLTDDNQYLRGQLTIQDEQIMEERDRELPQISTFIDIIEEEEDNRNQNRNHIPIYSIPPHIRQNYLQNLSDGQCSICLEEVELDNTMHLTDCGHLFHIACINRHRNTNNTCPVCRTDLR